MFIILEMQTDLEGNTTVVQPVQTRNTWNEAASIYHSLLAYAAISSVPYHSVTLLHYSGDVRAYEMFTHLPEPEPEVEPTSEDGPVGES